MTDLDPQLRPPVFPLREGVALYLEGVDIADALTYAFDRNLSLEVRTRL